ncbi:hypothetical protein [Streptomyces sp. NPDC048350]|uniref:hypothetical protein n=1 Tax=Streptomyces sp. NPDC048350 TaxID=3365538 RepID=UPI003712D1D3
MSATELDAVVVTSLVEDAIRPPTMHNAQPRKFVHRTGSRSIALYADPGRTLPVATRTTAPCAWGAARPCHLRVCAAHHGWTADARLLPGPDDSWRLAPGQRTAPAHRWRRPPAHGPPSRRTAAAHQPLPPSDESHPAPVLAELRSAAAVAAAGHLQ